MLLEQILRRQEEYRQSLGVVPAAAPTKPARIRKASTKLKVVPDLIEEEQVAEILEQPAPLPAFIEPTAEELDAIELTDSGVYTLAESDIPGLAIDLISIFEKYVPKKGVKVPSKTMGLPVPEELHARMLKFLGDNKDKPGGPQSLRDVGLMCLGYTMDALELPHGDDESVL